MRPLAWYEQIQINKRRVKLMSKTPKTKCELCGKLNCADGKNACPDCIKKHDTKRRVLMLNIISAALVFATFVQVPLQNVADEWVVSTTATTSLSLRMLLAAAISGMIVCVVQLMKSVTESQKTAFLDQIALKDMTINDQRNEIAMRDMEIKMLKPEK